MNLPLFLDIDLVQRITNHPLHILDRNGNLNPSAFIPFCGIGRNMTSMGVFIEHFSFPICRSFRATVLNDQLCYELNPNEYIGQQNLQESLRVGITLVIDNNEDREVTEVSYEKASKVFDNNILDILFQKEKLRTSTIHIHTIGKMLLFHKEM